MSPTVAGSNIKNLSSNAADIERSQCAFRSHTCHCTNTSVPSGNMERSSQRVIHAYAHVRTNQVLYSFTPYIHVRFPVRQSPSSIYTLLTICRMPLSPGNSPTPAQTLPSPICAKISGALSGLSQSPKANTQTLKAATSSRN